MQPTAHGSIAPSSLRTAVDRDIGATRPFRLQPLYSLPAGSGLAQWEATCLAFSAGLVLLRSRRSRRLLTTLAAVQKQTAKPSKARPKSGFSNSKPSSSSSSSSSGVQPDIILDVDDPLFLASQDAEDAIWEHPKLEELMTMMINALTEKQKVSNAMKFYEFIISRYSILSSESQVRMLVSNVMQRRLPSEGVGNEEDDNNSLEEPLSFRSLSAPYGIEAYALDLYLWRGTLQKGLVKQNRGFAGNESLGFSGAWAAFEEELAPLHPDDDRDFWIFIRSAGNVLEKLPKAYARKNTAACIFLPKAYFTRLQAEDLSAIESRFASCEIRTYVGSMPPFSKLVSTENSVVLVVREPRLPADEASWSLLGSRAEAESVDHRLLDTENAAPIVVISAMKHIVKMNLQGLLKKVLQLCEEFEEESLQKAVEEKEVSPIWNPLAFFNQTYTNHAAELLSQMRSKIQPLVRKEYSARWQLLRQDRMRELLAARKAAEASAARQKASEEQRQTSLSKLTEAISTLDLKSFKAECDSAQLKGYISSEKRSELTADMDRKLEEAEAPFRTLVNLSCSTASATDPMWEDAHHELREALSSTKLPNDSSWRQAGGLLLTAIEALNDVWTAASANATSAAEQQLSEGSMKDGVLNSMKDKIQKLSQVLTVAEAAVERFERSARALGATVTAPGDSRLRQLVSQGRSTLADANRDEALREALTRPPWADGLPSWEDVEPQHLSELEVRASRATDIGRARFADGLNEALSVGRCALELRQATKGVDPLLLVSRLDAARLKGLRGLESAERRLQLLQDSLQNLEFELEKSVETLDIPRFQRAASGVFSGVFTALPQGRLEAFETALRTAIAEAERPLKELLFSFDDVSVEGFRKALATTLLPESNSLRQAAEAAQAALESSDEVRSTLAAPWDAQALKDSISSATTAMARFKASLRELQVSPFDEGTSSGSAIILEIQEALDAGYAGLAIRQADEALATVLQSPPWASGSRSLQAIDENNLQELEARAEKASEMSLKELAPELETALKVGRTAVALRMAFSASSDVTLLGQLLEEARTLGIQGLEALTLRFTRLQSTQKSPAHTTPTETVPPPVTETLPSLQQATDSQLLQDMQPQQQHGAYLPAASKLGSAFLRRSNYEERSTNLIFIDLELTSGFYDFDLRPSILEAAIVVTDKDFNECERGHWVIGGFSREYLDSLGEFHRATFRDPRVGGLFPPFPGDGGGNGLFSDVMASTLTKEQVEEEMLTLIRRHCPEGACPLVGYSVQCDREVLKDEMPRFYRHVSHQILDVSGFFTVTRMWASDANLRWERRQSTYNHRAVNDVEDAIQALRWVRQTFFRSQDSANGSRMFTNSVPLGFGSKN